MALNKPVMRMKRITPRGFTLIELLVVVAIITLLLGILLPSLGKARRAAQGTVCANQLRQIATAIFNYAGNSGGTLPATKGLSALPFYQLVDRTDGVFDPTVNPGYVSTPGSSRYFANLELANVGSAKSPNDRTPGVLAAYLNEPKTWFCPLVPLDVRAHLATSDDWTYRRIGTTYLYNLYTVHFETTMNGQGYHAPGRVIGGRRTLTSPWAPGSAVLLWDEPAASRGSTAGDDGALESWLDLPHGEGINVAYADGHVQRQAVRDITSKIEKDSNGKPYDVTLPAPVANIWMENVIWTPTQQGTTMSQIQLEVGWVNPEAGSSDCMGG